MRELNMREIGEVSGGLDLQLVLLGLGAIGLGATILATAGLATVPISIMSAAFAGEMVVAGSAMTLGAVGGAAIGTGITAKPSVAGTEDENS